MSSLTVQDLPKLIKMARETTFLSNYDLGAQHYQKALKIIRK
jgi:hypothetical protein